MATHQPHHEVYASNVLRESVHGIFMNDGLGLCTGTIKDDERQGRQRFSLVFFFFFFIISTLRLCGFSFSAVAAAQQASRRRWRCCCTPRHDVEAGLGLGLVWSLPRAGLDWTRLGWISHKTEQDRGRSEHPSQHGLTDWLTVGSFGLWNGTQISKSSVNAFTSSGGTTIHGPAFRSRHQASTPLPFSGGTHDRRGRQDGSWIFFISLLMSFLSPTQTFAFAAPVGAWMAWRYYHGSMARMHAWMDKWMDQWAYLGGS
ncbi:hypothetical protein N658DRAFT_183860 [Parathielavia hyrcaniae]|uniref:Uncharacterized protein n=1 Tax=Parathielavia hyrcaniae TaxID=113614 RepID=A0AAN6Q6U3_9PEZI|nr:hypothetical protein N658DRAFT_183860 [Parathielavia hyrcaniae]